MTRTERLLLVLLVGAVGAAAYGWGRGAAPPLVADTANANRDMVAVTGEFGMGTSVLYLVDTRRKVLLVYEAKGGTQGSVRLVAARDIRYDLELRSYRDRSEEPMSVLELERRWRRRHGGPGGPKTQSRKKRP